ncbi:MAG: hypothetical protein NTV29_11180 [Planctomycetota bacterium]|nr:hypothetical protein [Planctomycetota bacterium]
MRPPVEHIQFPRKTWQTVTEHALRELAFHESCDQSSRIENLRPCYFEDETENAFGRQIWCFEAMGLQVGAGRKLEFGVLEFSIEYGLIELSQCRWFQNDNQLEQWISQRLDPHTEPASCCVTTKLWVYLAILGILFLAIGWTVSLFRFLNVSI